MALSIERIPSKTLSDYPEAYIIFVLSRWAIYKKNGKSLEICHIFGNLDHMAALARTLDPYRDIFLFKYHKND